MSDFDKFFADKLNEEQEFPRREKNWQGLSGRLDAFDLGGRSPGRMIRYWQIAASVAIVVAGWLFWKTNALHEEIASLKQEISVLQQQNKRADDIINAGPQGAVPETKSGNPNDRVSEAPNPVQSANKTGINGLSETDRPTKLNTGKSPSISNKQFATSEGNKPPRANEKRTSTNKKEDTSTITNTQPSTYRKETKHQDIKTANTVAPQTPENATANLPSSKPDTTAAKPAVTVGNSSATAGVAKPDSAAAKSVETVGKPVEGELATTDNSSAPAGVAKPDSSTIRNAAAPANPQDSTSVMPSKDPLPKTDTAAVTKLPSKNETKQDSTLAQAKTEPEIKPVRRYPRFRIGVQLVAGTPVKREKGISFLTGNGVTASFSPLKNIWITASADWLHFDVSVDTFLERYHLPDPPHHPQGGMDDHKLVLLESSQRQQHFALGLRYALPFHGWIRPSVQVAHSWVRLSPGIVTYKFVDDHWGPGHPQDPEYFAERSEAKVLDNIWRFGIGLEHETPRWTFGVWTDYTKSFDNADPGFDALYARAGIQYRL